MSGHRLVTRRGTARALPRCSLISVGVPWTRIAPATSTAIRVANRKTTSISCSISSTAIDAGSCAIASKMMPTSARRHASGRLVEQQQSRLERQRDRRAPPSAARRTAAPRPASRAASCRRSADRISATRASIAVADRRFGRRQPGDAPLLGDRQRQVLLDGQPAKQAGDLERAPDARLHARGLGSRVTSRPPMRIVAARSAAAARRSD